MALPAITRSRDPILEDYLPTYLPACLKLGDKEGPPIEGKEAREWPVTSFAQGGSLRDQDRHPRTSTLVSQRFRYVFAASKLKMDGQRMTTLRLATRMVAIHQTCRIHAAQRTLIRVSYTTA